LARSGCALGAAAADVLEAGAEARVVCGQHPQPARHLRALAALHAADAQFASPPHAAYPGKDVEAVASIPASYVPASSLCCGWSWRATCCAARLTGGSTEPTTSF
jgi:hypothetical protein